jgi:phage terminase large subunit-like protein
MHSTNIKNKLWVKYAQDVLSGEVKTGRYIRALVERFVEDVEREKSGGGEWMFHVEQGERYLDFIQKFCVHTRGAWAGKPFILTGWQQFFLINVFGWVHREKGFRRYRTALLFVARKSGKTQLAAAIALAMMLLDKEPAGEYVFAAAKRDQARICFDELSRMIRNGPPELRKRFEARRHDILGPYEGLAKALSSDANTLDGLSLQLGVLDEYHAQKTSDLWNVLKSSMGSRKSPLMLAITTAGFIPDGPCAEAMKTAKDVLDGLKEDERTFAMIFQIDTEEGDEWQNEEVWLKANPNIGESISLEYLRSQATQARNNGGRAIVEFQTKHCNLFTASSEVWIEREIWMNQATDFEPSEGAICYAGLDLASVSDVSSLSLIFSRSDGSCYLRSFHWLPELAVKRRLEKDENSIYGKLAELPNVFITDGNATDYDSIREFISGVRLEGNTMKQTGGGIAAKYNLRGLAYDRFNSSQLIIDLTGDGISCVPYGQGFVSMNAPTKELERLVLEGDLWHEGCPFFTWMMGNVTLRFDPAGNAKPDKEKSGDKIDGPVSAVMALAERMIRESEPDDSIPKDWMPRFI